MKKTKEVKAILKEIDRQLWHSKDAIKKGLKIQNYHSASHNQTKMDVLKMFRNWIKL